MAGIRRIPYRLWLLLALLAALAISFINPTDPRDMLLEHTPTAALLGFLIWNDRRQPLSNLAYTLIFGFLILHIVGAHYLYSNVPYDDWSQWLLGESISSMFGLKRNHYDRFVHLMFGLLMVLPMVELVERYLRLAGAWAIIVSVAFLAVFSKVYELIEWTFALVMDPENAEKYNGQQGDMFDAHKDMALALAGSIISAIVVAVVRRRS